MEDEKKVGVLQKALGKIQEAKDLLKGEEIEAEETQTEETVEQTETEVEETETETLESGEEGEEEASESESEESEEEEEENLEALENPTSKDIIKRLDALEQKEYKQEKEIKALKKENQELKEKKVQKAQKDLLQKTIAETKQLKIPVENEEQLKKELQKHFTEEEIEKDLYGCIKTYQVGLKIAKSKIPDGMIPNLTDETLSKEQDENKIKADEIRKNLQERGNPNPKKEDK